MALVSTSIPYHHTLSTITQMICSDTMIYLAFRRIDQQPDTPGDYLLVIASFTIPLPCTIQDDTGDSL